MKKRKGLSFILLIFLLLFCYEGKTVYKDIYAKYNNPDVMKEIEAEYNNLSIEEKEKYSVLMNMLK